VVSNEKEHDGLETKKWENFKNIKDKGDSVIIRIIEN
jgi:hypothetical protein